MTLSFSALNIRQEHLDVPIATEATFSGSLANVKGGRVTIVSFFDGAVESGQLGEDRYDTWCFVLDLLLLDEAAISANAIDNSNLGACS
jgi:hypothetical protein